MAKKSLKFVSDKKLKQAYKQSKILTISQGFLVIIIAVFAVFYTTEKGISVFTFLPLFFLPMVIIGLFQMKEFKAEIKRRNVNVK